MNKCLAVVFCVVFAGCEKGSEEPVWQGSSGTPSLRLNWAGKSMQIHGAIWKTARNGKLESVPQIKVFPPPLDGSAHAGIILGYIERVIEEGGVPLGGKMLGFKDKLMKKRISPSFPIFRVSGRTNIQRMVNARRAQIELYSHINMADICAG